MAIAAPQCRRCPARIGAGSALRAGFEALRGSGERTEHPDGLAVLAECVQRARERRIGPRRDDVADEHVVAEADAARARLDAGEVDRARGELGEAVDELAGSELVRKALGPHIFDRYVELKRAEWDEYRVQLTEWELKKYLSVL